MGTELTNRAVKRSVLIVDDESSNIAALTRMLSTDYTVYSAKSGKSAIAAAERYLPDVVLLDILMPETDGYAVIVALKNSEKTQHIPVIFITGLGKTDEEEKGLAMGAADYICKPFSPAIVKLRLHNQIKILDQLHKIEQLGTVDQLTNLPNRRSFEHQLAVEWARSQRERLYVSILMIDVDHFKHYNDTFGHLQGDAALQAVATVFTQVLKRPCDFAARWGGEEFVILLPNTDANGAFHVAEQLRKDVEETSVRCKDGSETKITVSIGVNAERPSNDDSCDSFISKADMALYRAKKEGRNKVTVADKKFD